MDIAEWCHEHVFTSTEGPRLMRILEKKLCYAKFALAGLYGAPY